MRQALVRISLPVPHLDRCTNISGPANVFLDRCTNISEPANVFLTRFVVLYVCMYNVQWTMDIVQIVTCTPPRSENLDLYWQMGNRLCRQSILLFCLCVFFFGQYCD